MHHQLYATHFNFSSFAYRRHNEAGDGSLDWFCASPHIDGDHLLEFGPFGTLFVFIGGAIFVRNSWKLSRCAAGFRDQGNNAPNRRGTSTN
jgi:hypothetical protein